MNNIKLIIPRLTVFIIVYFIAVFYVNVAYSQCSATSGPTYACTCANEYFTSITASGTGVTSTITLTGASCTGTYINDYSTQGVTASTGGTVNMTVVRNFVAAQGRMPLIRKDCLPKEPQALLWIHEQTRIGVREARRIGEQESLAPTRVAFALACPFNDDIIGPTFAGAVVPTDEQIAIGTFDNAGSVVVPAFWLKNQLPLEKRPIGAADAAR